MAKKKVSKNQENHQVENTLKPHNKDIPKPTIAVNVDKNEVSLQKLENLKSLNTMLLKEAVERRQQVKALNEAKGCLESELTRSNSENEGLVSELTHLSERFFRLEMERNFVFAFITLQVKQHGEAIEKERDAFRREKMEIEEKMLTLESEMREILREKGEIEREKREKDCEIVVLNEKINEIVDEIGKGRDFAGKTIKERDELRVKLNDQIEYSEGLRGKLIETEERQNGLRNKIDELVVKYKRVVEEKEQREMRIEIMMSEKDAIEKSLMEATGVIDEMKGKIQGIVKEKESVEEDWNVQKMKNSELENTVSRLNEMVMSLQQEEEKLRSCMAELGKKCAESMVRAKEMGLEIQELAEENREKEKRIDTLVAEKGLAEKELFDALKRLSEQKLNIEQLVNEKVELEEGAERKESVIAGLRMEVQESRDAIREVENSLKCQVEKIKNMESKVGYYKEALKQVTMERDEARKEFDEEKRNGLSLKEKNEEFETNIEKNLKLVEELKAENVNMMAKMEELKSHYELLKEDLASKVYALSEVQKEFDASRSKVELGNTDSERVLSMLKSITELIVSKDEKNDTDEDRKQMVKREVADSFAAELELIKNAFEKKESQVEDMKQRLVCLQNSVVEAHKKKSFWALLSSATTFFAAISLAYIARGH